MDAFGTLSTIDYRKRWSHLSIVDVLQKIAMHACTLVGFFELKMLRMREFSRDFGQPT